MCKSKPLGASASCGKGTCCSSSVPTATERRSTALHACIPCWMIEAAADPVAWAPCDASPVGLGSPSTGSLGPTRAAAIGSAFCGGGGLPGTEGSADGSSSATLLGLDGSAWTPSPGPLCSTRACLASSVLLLGSGGPGSRTVGGPDGEDPPADPGESTAGAASLESSPARSSLSSGILGGVGGSCRSVAPPKTEPALEDSKLIARELSSPGDISSSWSCSPCSQGLVGLAG